MEMGLSMARSHLLIASTTGNVSMLEFVLSETAVDVNTRHEQLGGPTSLQLATQHGHVEIVKRLLAANADPNVPNANGVTSLFVASQQGFVQVVEMLLAGGADVNAADHNGSTSLLIASSYGRVHVVEHLLQAGANVNAAKRNGVTSLLIASQQGHAEVVERLLLAGANPDSAALNGATCLLIASQQGHTEVVAKLLTVGANPNAAAQGGYTGLRLALENGHLGIVEKLLTAGADPNAATQDGTTCLYAASKRGHSELVVRLLNAGADPNAAKTGGLTSLHMASQFGYLDIVKKLLSVGADPNASAQDEANPLSLASGNGHLDIVEALLDAGADPNLPLKNGAPGLLMASQEGHLEIVEKLLDAGADPFVMTENGWTCLSVASKSGHVQIVEKLLHARADPSALKETGQPSLSEASYNGQLEIVEKLLNAGADPNAVGQAGATCLLMASKGGHLAIVERLLNAGADLEAASEDGTTCLFAASEEGHLEVVEKLLSLGADPNAEKSDGTPPLFAASQRGHSAVVELLLKEGADPNMVTPSLFTASKRGHAEVAELLLLAGANPNAVTWDGTTCLLVASQQGHVEVVEKLLVAGADPSVPYPDGRTSLFVASQEGHDEVVEKLLRRRVDPNAMFQNGATCLFEASKAGHSKVVRLLLSAGAEVNATKENGESALLVASVLGHIEVVDILLKAGADPNATNKAGATCLAAASIFAHSEIIENLLAHGADPNANGPSGYTALFIASQMGHTSVVEKLLQVRSDPNSPAEGRASCLFAASHDGHSEVVESLLAAGADPNATTKEGMTALHIASANGHKRVVFCFLRSKSWESLVGAVDQHRRTPLHLASQNHRSDVVELLLSHHAPLHSKDFDGRAPLHMALLRQPDGAVTSSTLSTLQAFASSGVSWDATCDALALSGQAWEEVEALRVCMRLWAQEHASHLPLTHVEVAVVKRGPESTETYIIALKKSKKILCRSKVCVVGPSQAGKTSLIKSLAASLPSLEHPDVRTMGIDHFGLRLFEQVGKDSIIHDIMFWDFAGQNQYQVAHSLYYSGRTQYLVCIDAEALSTAFMQADLMGSSPADRDLLMNEFVERDVLKWVRGIFSHQPQAEFVFVCTKDDFLMEFPAFGQLVKAVLATRLTQVEGIVTEMQREWSKPVPEGQREAVTLTLHAYQERVQQRAARSDTNRFGLLTRGTLQLQKKFSTTVNTLAGKFRGEGVKVSSMSARPSETLFVSCIKPEAVIQARKDVIALITKSERSFRMPEDYANVLDAVIAMRKSPIEARAKVDRPFVPINLLVESLLRIVTGINQKSCKLILQTLHDLGDVLWYDHLTTFKENIIIDPLILVDFVRQVITHDRKGEVLPHAELVELPQWKELRREDLMLAMKKLLHEFQLVLPVTDRMTSKSDLIVPGYWQSKTPASWLFLYQDLELNYSTRKDRSTKPAEAKRVHFQFIFEYEFPDTLFDHLIVETYSPFFKRAAGPDWILYAKDLVSACRVMVVRDKLLRRVLQLEAVLAEGAQNTETERELWEIFDRLSAGIEKVLRRYAGLVVSRVVLNDEFEPLGMDTVFAFLPCRKSLSWMPPDASFAVFKKAPVKRTMTMKMFASTKN